MKITASKRDEEWPKLGTHNGVQVRFYKNEQNKGGTKYTVYLVRWTLRGELKTKGFGDWEQAKQFAEQTCEGITEQTADAPTLTTNERFVYERAVEWLPEGATLDEAASVYAKVMKIIAGYDTTPEAIAHDWVKRNKTQLPRITTSAAVEKLLAQEKKDNKSQRRIQQLAAPLRQFAEAISVEVHTITFTIVSAYLRELTLAEKTKKNHRDAIGYFNRTLIRDGYLEKGTDWLDGVQEYSGRKFGKITTYTPQELAKLLVAAQRVDKPMVPALTLGAFAGLRTAEISRIDWAEIDFDDGAEKSEPHVEVSNDITKNGETGEARRIVPMKENLRTWLTPYRKDSGKVCPFSEKQVAKHWKRIAEAAGIPWKKNALRHTCISARIAECGDKPRVADESGNSTQVIKTNYLKRMKPKQAEQWFAITPENVSAAAKGDAVVVQ
jgi:integrase